MRNRITIFFLLLLGLLNAVVAADFSLQVGNVIWSGSPGGYNCFSSAAYPNTVNFTITKQGNGSRSYAVTAGTSANAGTYSRQLASGANRLNYQFYTTSAMSYVLEAPPTANSYQVISGSSGAKGGTVIPLSFTFYIPPNQLVPPGTYTDHITMSIYQAYNDNGAPESTSTITVSVIVAPVVNLCLVPTGSGFNSSSTSQNLDFGVLGQNQSKSCDLLVRKNTGCSVAFSSGNLGVLKITTSGNYQVPYTFQVNGGPLNLSQTASLTLPTGVSTSQDGTRLPVTVTPGSTANAAAGNYQDQVTITATVQ